MSRKCEERISKSGKVYFSYYQKKFPNGKKNKRKLCLERDDYTCQICGTKEKLDVHHKDNGGPHIKGNKTNNELVNLTTLCHRCHLKLHYGVLGKIEDIRALREQGKTLQEIADHYGVSRQRIHQLTKKYIFTRQEVSLTRA